MTIEYKDSKRIVLTKTTPIVWQNMTDGQTASGNVLSKSGANWTADATSTATFSSSVGAKVEFTVSANSSDSFCGFDISTNTDSYDMDYALYCGGGGTINIYANGSQVNATGVSYSTADTLAVNMDSSGTVTFLKNGSVFYTSSTTASGTYRVNAVIYTSGVSLTANYITDKPTNVQDNSILVEKDTARRYWFESGSSETLSQETESGTGELFNDVEIVAQKFTTGSSKIGKKVSSVAFYLKRNTSTIGSTNLQCFVGAGNQSSAVAYGTLPATSLTTSYAWYTFTPSVAGTERTLVADDRIMIRWADGSTTSDAVRMASDQLGNNPLANETGQYSADDGSNFTNRSFDYMYKIISTTPATWTMTPTFEDDFSSSAGWTQVTNTASGVSGGELIGLTNSSGTNGAGVWKDYGLIFDNDKFVLRCKFQIVTQSGGSGNASTLYFGLSDTNGATSPHSARDGFGIAITNYAASGMLWTYPNNATWDNADTDLSLTPTQTTYYLEIARTSATSVTFTLYSDEYNTVVKTHTQAITSTLNDLRYLMFQEWRNGSGNTTKVAVSELKLYNGVSTIN